MSSFQGLPTRGSDVTILITRTHLYPLCVLVEFWGKFWQERAADYECLSKDIQSPGNPFLRSEGNPGDQCLVQIDGIWYRSRVVSRTGSNYSVFLIDKGRTHSTTTSKLAWGKKKHFQLPPEVELCVLANVLPLLPENGWSPMALEFLKSLHGKSVKAHVQDVLVLHRTFLLHIPCISKQMYEMGMAKKLSPDVFQDFVLMSLQSHSAAIVSPESPITMGAAEQLRKKELFMYPELPAGTMDTVIVTEVTNPQRIFCQLKVFSQELKKLSEQLTQCCEGRMSNCIVGPEMIGFPCAARGSDGRWFRSVLHQVFQTSKVVEVFNVDYGTKQFVKVDNVRPLAAEFFRMPVVTYICSLHGIIDKGVGWTTSQIDYLRTLLLHKTVIAKFEYQSIFEGVHYVTLYGDKNTNINDLFGSKENCFLEEENALRDYAIRSTARITPGQAAEEKEGKGLVKKLPAEDLDLNSSYVAVVQHVSDPSEFWIQTRKYANELDELMDSIYHLYKDSVNKDMVRNPTVGLYCAAKAEDGEFYRATVAEVGEQQITVFFVDYGNTEVVDRRDIRTLPDEFKKLPCLSLKCTLAGVRPKDGRWSRDACEFFIKAVTDKELTVHVTTKYNEGYVVQLTDPEAQGERDLSMLMCSSGLAERAETQRQPKAKMTTQPAILPQLPDARLSGVYRNKGTSFQSPNTVGPASNERIPTFKEQMFPSGSVLDVSVSFIESPNDFWCQNIQNTGHLNLLMRGMQAHYAGSEFQPIVETACVARHPDNGMWYRALVIHKHETHDVDVLFVDYGQTETVSLFDLRRISPHFLTLHSQAFRCSLLNLADPASAINEWNEEAVERFHNFVETAASDFKILKCTIYAVMRSEQKIVFNIVDLETPFESICTSMVNLVKSAPSKTAAGPSFCLDTYYYSTHNVKIGTEEQVTVTCVNNVSQFYCQLERNADVIKDLKIKVSKLCHQIESVRLPTVFGTLCFAKYTDGQWYRGQIKATKPAIVVHFVDYGDTIVVEKSDLLPLPREANNIMSVPVQAVVCSLSDVPADVPSEVNSWFEKSVTECKFRALVVAREPDGKLLVELYHGNTQVNSKIKKMFQIGVHTEKEVVHQGQKALDASGKPGQKTRKVVPKQAAAMEDHIQTSKIKFSAPKPAHQVKDAKVKAAPLELYIPPHQRQSCRKTPSNTGNGSEQARADVKPRKESSPADTKEFHKSKSPGTESQKESNAEILPKLADLPSKCITSDMEADVYVSDCNSPLSFHVQLFREEDEIFSLVEKLNDPQFTLLTNDIKDVQPGDLVQAEFADDSSWYRAVVREIHSETMALIQFVDFGNTAMMPISKIGRLHKSFLQLPMYSIHCMLSEAAGLAKEEVLDPEVVSSFKEDIGGNGEKVLKCQFIRQSGPVWEVSLEDSGVNVTCKVPTRYSTDGTEITSEKHGDVKEKTAQKSDIGEVPENSCSLCYHQQEFSEGQKLEVYITAINNAQTFWCQPADSEELDKIASRASEVGDAVNHKHFDPGSLSPGSACIALFSDDCFWYRAEVIERDGDKLSVLFVDYGNKSQVSVADVREITPDLMETTPQAFLCELEGFDASHGSWDSGAVAELSALTTDKVLQLTVTRATREEGKMKYFVRMECEGQMINKALETWWKSSTTENKPGAVGLTTYKIPLQRDSTVKETAPPEDEPQYPESQEIGPADACIDPQRDDRKEQSTGELVDSHPDILPCDSGIDSPLDKNGDQRILTLSCDRSAVESDNAMNNDTEVEGSLVRDYIGPDDLNSPLDENPMEAIDKSEIASTEFESLDESRREAIDQSKIATTDLESLDENIMMVIDESEIATTECESPDENPAQVIDESEISTTDSEFVDENPMEAMDELAITTDSKSLLGEVNTHSMESSFDIMTSSDPTEERDDSEVTVARDNSPTSTTTVKMVPREAVGPRESVDLLETHENISDDLKQTETELVLPPCVLPAFERDIEAGDDVTKEELPCVSTHVETDSLTGEETLAQHEETYSADTDTAASEPQTCTVLFDGGEEVTCSVEEACLTDICTDPNEPSDDDDKVTSAREECVSSVTAEDTQALVKNESPVPQQLTETPSEHQIETGEFLLQDEAMHDKSNSVTEDETSALHQDQLMALPSDTEPTAHTAPHPDLSDPVEEATCLVGPTDVCRDPQQEAEREDSEQLLHTPSTQKEEFSDSVLEGEMPSSDDDSFEAQLSRITHLCLIINDGSADLLLAEKQPEE